MKLPGGFSPWQAIQQGVDTINPLDGGHRDRDVFSDVSFEGGDRNPTVTSGSVLGVSYGPQQYATGPGAGNQPAPGVQGTNDVNTGGGGGGGYVAPDPYARWGGKANFDAMRGGFVTSQNNQRGAAQQSLTDVGNTYDVRSRNFVNDIREGQGEINQGGARNQLNLRQSMADIVEGIQTGMRSGNVALAGMNALSSGAAEAMARAYAKIGNRQTGEARGQASEISDELQRKQGTLNQTKKEGQDDLKTYKTTETGRVRNDFSSKLDTIRSQAAAQGINDVVADNLVDQVLNEAMARLQTIDTRTQQGLSGIEAWTPEQIMAEAIRMEQAGQTGNPFGVTGAEVSYGQGGGLSPVSGAPIANLPIYMRNRDEQSVVPMRGREELALA